MSFLVPGRRTSHILRVEGVPSYTGLQGHGISEEYQPEMLDPTKLS